MNDRQAGRHRLRDEVSEGQEQREKERERETGKEKKRKNQGNDEEVSILRVFCLSCARTSMCAYARL